MKKKIIIPGVILALLAIFFSFKFTGNAGNGADDVTSNEEKTILETVMALIERAHFSPRAIDDSFAYSVFDKTISGLDYEKKFFTKEDYESLKSTYRANLKDDIKNNSLDFFYEINQLFIKRIDEANALYPKILEKPFQFNTKDSIQMNFDKIEFASGKKGWESRWNQYLKYRVLSKYVDLKNAEKKKTEDSAGYKVKPFKVLEKEARESVAKTQKRYFERLSKLTDNDRFSMYMNAIASAEDPHTDYMPPEKKSRFDEMMSGSFYGIGAALQQQEDGVIKISEIITGSPAWKDGRLKAKDIVLKVAQKGSQDPPMDVDGMDLSDVVKKIRGAKGTEVILTVKHDNGSVEDIEITRGKVELEYIFAKSAVIEDQGKKIGYIYLPEFYADFNGVSNRRSGVDVRIEVEKLKEEGVDGIILDLRNNGGGSLSDVVDMAGLFIGSGPVVQVMGSGDVSRPLTVNLSEPVYNGPLAVMVNGNSASASEILAAAMQDYERAVIVGSRTFGKGTVQKLIPLDRFVNQSLRQQIINALNKAKGGDVEYQGIGSLKLTIQKFYRVDGGSTQLKGVEPDILFPSAFETSKQGERREASALPWDKIKPLQYSKWTEQLPLDALKDKSEKRINQNDNFSLIKEMAVKVQERQESNFVHLSLDGYEKALKKSKEFNKKLSALDSVANNLKVINLAVDFEKANIDSASAEKNTTWLKNIRKDIYIQETTNVLKDWIGQL